jgi:hypothetical protein
MHNQFLVRVTARDSPTVIAKLTSAFVTYALAINAPTGDGNIKTPAGANVILIIISP